MNFIHVNQVVNFIDKLIFKNISSGSYCLRNDKFTEIVNTYVKEQPKMIPFKSPDVVKQKLQLPKLNKIG